VAFSLVLVGLVLLRRLPQAVLFPAFALHGYVLSASVLGWTTMPIASYLLGLLISQAVLLLVALQLLRKGAARLSLQARQLLASGLLGSGAAWAWSAMVG
jgi:urease accessory protein